MTFHSNWNARTGVNDCWGYTAPNGDEYALVGSTSGTSVINVTDPAVPYETGFIPGPSSTWRDIKTYSTYAYVTTEAGGGLEIIDLSDPENPADLANYTGGFTTAHNIYIDTTTARAYIAGSNLGSGGVRILDLSVPTAPVEIGSWETAYFHDVMVQNGRLYGSAIWADTIYVLDVSNPASVTVLGSKTGYPNAFTHNAWVTEDDNYLMTTDELTGSACRMWDLTNLPTITQSSIYLPNPATIPHNAHIEGDYAYISHYSLGVRIVDISDPFNVTEVGYYDTYPNNDAGGYNGCWGAFPFFETSPDLLLASDRSTGLYVLSYSPPGSAVDAPVVAAADGFRVDSGAPNPFRAGELTTVALQVPAAGPVRAEVFDVSGRRVADLLDETLAPGAHRITWDGRAADGAKVPAGTYFLKVRTDAGQETRKMVVVR
ncbi:MAG: choice-of-anchor B family protein [Gemmatimonadetes bacterium]|nr:choice-of-anchor B family protein [Gemmatimonadota bacterium]